MEKQGKGKEDDDDERRKQDNDGHVRDYDTMNGNLTSPVLTYIGSGRTQGRREDPNPRKDGRQTGRKLHHGKKSYRRIITG